MKMDFHKLLISTSLIILSSVFCQAQTAVFKCDDARYFDRHTADEDFNILIDSACVMLNKKKYDIALRLLNSAIVLDSTRNAGSSDIYISSQRNKLEKFINSQNEKPEVETEPSDNKPLAKVEDTASQKAEETPAPKVDEAPTAKVEEAPAPKVEEAPAPKKEEAPAPKIEEAPTPKVDEAPTPKVEEAPTAKVEEAPTPKVEEAPTAKVEDAPNTKVEQAPAPKVEEAPTAASIEEAQAPKREESPASSKDLERTNDSQINGSNTTAGNEELNKSNQQKGQLLENTKPELTKKDEIEDPFVENTTKNKPTQTDLSAPTKTFSEEEKNEFQSKGLQKVTELEGYLKQICDQETSQSITEEVINGALGLFDSENRVVQVSSLNSDVKARLKIRKYLEKLRMLPYDNVRIEWAEFQYTSDFIKGDDGNYHGYVIFRQRFSAMKDQQVIYSDMTTKKAEVILKMYRKAVEGVETEKWDVFLGDISVEQTSKN